MTGPELAVQQAEAAVPRSRVTNDLSIQVATVNGSGSQTANLVLLRAIFQMGIPVSGKNLFPSNIAGLPTWFTIRASRYGYIGRKKEIDVLVALNPETARDDVAELEPGAVVVFDEPLRLDSLRADLVFYPVPFDKLIAPCCPDAKLRRLVRNMIYDGVLARLLGIEVEQVERALAKQLAKKPKALALNQGALRTGYDFAGAHLPKRDPFVLERMDGTAGMILVEGNRAAAVGAMMAGVTVVTWYPITPSSSLCEALSGYMRKYRMDKETGKATFAIVQAEDELSALGMAIGAGWAGARSMTATSGPGISLMAEFAGLGYWAEVPAVIFDIQRAGPSTGLPTRTSQGDILSTAFLSHGDTKHLLLLPSSPGEIYSMAIEAFDLAERFQTPVFVMSDLDLGMNTWMSDPFPYPSSAPDRGKLLDEETLKRIGEWGRYKDVDGDGVPYRTIPGSAMPAYFCRGSGHNERAQYSERPHDYESMLDRLARKLETARQVMPRPEIIEEPGSEVALIAYGTSHWAVTESRDQLRDERGLKASYLRLRAYPFAPEVAAFVARHERVYVVEQNRDAQMGGLLKLDLPAGEVGKLRFVRHYNGLPMDARTVTDEVLSQEGLTSKRPDRGTEAPSASGSGRED